MPVAVLLVIVAAPPTCSCTTNVPVFWIVALLILTLLMFEPETNWIASYGLCWIRMLSTLVRPVIAPSRASNQSAPTPNCQFGSRLPDRMIVLRSTSVRPERGRGEPLRDVDAAALGQAGVDDPVVGDEVVVAAVDRDAVGQDRVLHRVVVERVVRVGVLLGPGGQAVVAEVAEVAVGDLGVGDAVVEVDAVGGEVADAACR